LFIENYFWGGVEETSESLSDWIDNKKGHPLSKKAFSIIEVVK
jgi:hypothetical protein